MRSFCRIPLVVFWLLFATSTYALSDEQAEALEGGSDYICGIAATGSWKIFTKELDARNISVVYALQNLRCSYDDQNADRQINPILHRVTFVAGTPGSFTDGVVRYLRDETEIETMKSTMWVLVAPSGIEQTLLHDILEAYKAPFTSKKVKKELRYMAKTICHNLRLYEDGHLKTIYEDMCV